MLWYHVQVCRWSCSQHLTYTTTGTHVKDESGNKLRMCKFPDVQVGLTVAMAYMSYYIASAPAGVSGTHLPPNIIAAHARVSVRVGVGVRAGAGAHACLFACK